MNKIDAHQHFWRFDPVRDAWISSDTMQVLRRDFLPDDIAPTLAQHGFSGCVAVQADQSDAETSFLLQLAENQNFIKGVIGWTDLRASDLSQRLDTYAAFPLLKGFRHILQGEPPQFMLDSRFLAGVTALGKRGYTYDILVFPHHLMALRIFLRQLEHQPFVIDHLAKPYIKKGDIKAWKDDLRRIAQHDNVCCKLSGLVTEADWANWQPRQLTPYLEVALEAFGSQRVMYGSDHPVCLLASDYARQLAVVEDFIGQLTTGEQAAVMGGNAVRFYGLG
jgi:L-fuconolactonase